MAETIEGRDWTSYNLTVEHKVNIDELIYVLSPMDLPLFTGVGADGLPVIPRQPVDNRTFYWLEEDIPLPRATLNEELDNSETDVTLNTGEAVKFSVGDAFRIDDEVFIVTDINLSTHVLTVATRGQRGTSAATHSTGSEVIGLGTSLAEGEVGTANYKGRDKYSNYTQIWTRTLEVSRTEQRIPKYGVPNELNRQILNVMQHMGVSKEQAALYGVKYNDDATEIRTTGGLDAFITTNEDTTSEWLTVDGIETQQQAAYDAGGMFEMLMARPAAFGALNNVAGSERIQTVTIDDARRGRRRATTVVTEFGDVTLVRNRWVRNTDAFGYSRENFIYRDFQPMVLQRLAKTKDTDSYLIVCEGGFEVKGEDHMAKWSGLDSSAAFPTDLT